MTSARTDEREIGPALLCYDGSGSARDAIEGAGPVLGGGSAVVLTVWESAGSALLRCPLPETTEFGRDLREISRDVIDTFDADAARWAQATAAEGAALAGRAGFDARPRAHRTLERIAERAEATVWQAILAVAHEENASVLVLGSRGRSGVGAALLGSVSRSLVHHTQRPVLIVPPHG